MSNINELIIVELNNAEQVLAKKDKFTAQNVQNVLNNGGYRDNKQYVTGLNTGSKNLQKKYGIKEKFINPFSSRGAYTDPDLSTIHIPFPLWNMRRVSNFISNNPNASLWSKFKSGFDPSGTSTALERRHETDEARIGQNILLRHNMDPNTPGMVGTSFMTPTNPETGEFDANIKNPDPELAKRSGGHVSPQVLQNEKPISQYVSNFTNKLDHDIDYRNSSGEYGPSIQDLTPAQIRDIEDRSLIHNQLAQFKAQNLTDEFRSKEAALDHNFMSDNPTIWSKLRHLPAHLVNLVKNDSALETALQNNIQTMGPKYIMSPYKYEMNPEYINPILQNSFGVKFNDHGYMSNPNAI